MALVAAVSCDQLSCYEDTDLPEPYPERMALALDTPTATEDGQFELVLHAPQPGDWPPNAGPIALVLEVRGTEDVAELTTAPPFLADDEMKRGGEPDVSVDGPARFRIASSVPDPGLWCLPVDVAAADRDDGLDVCFEAR